MFTFSSVSKKEKGQGLVEYAVILALVAIVVIGSLKILGPQVGGTFSTINSSLPGVSSQPSPWLPAAREHGSFTLPAGTFEVQYGANGTFVSRTFTGPITVGCNNATFGDPLFGTVKSCSYR
jgi:Flp pilus assembly pilin Flp